MLLNESSKKPATKSSASASTYVCVEAKPTSARHHTIASSSAVRVCGRSQPLLSRMNPAMSAPRRIGREQHAVGRARVAVAEVGGEARHLRLVAVADEERRRAGEHRHRDDDRLAGDVAQGLHDVGHAPDRAARRGGGRSAGGAESAARTGPSTTTARRADRTPCRAGCRAGRRARAAARHPPPGRRARPDSGRWRAGARRFAARPRARCRAAAIGSTSATARRRSRGSRAAASPATCAANR